MCGIIGFNWEDKQLIKKLINLIDYRGPDDKGFYINNGISLGHCRLSYLDLSSRGKQPMSTKEEDLIIIFNGEIYNFKEIRSELEKKGYKFKTDTDTEVILYSYKEYGKNCVKFLRGMFAFAIFDINKKSFFLARDPFGIKPLYYYFYGEKFIFASEIKAIINSNHIKKQICKEALAKYLTYKYTPDEFTLFDEIKKVLPGTTLYLENKQISIEKYYDQSENITNKNLNYFIENLNTTLKDSVKAHMVADVEVGSFLSGGIDSSLISYYAQKLMKENKRNLKTFSIYFDHFSEKEYSSAVAEHLGTDHYSVQVNRKDVIKCLPKIMWHSDEPMTDFAAVPNYLLSKFARKKVKTVLAGQGADEIFGGYGHYTKMCKIIKSGKILGAYKFNNIYKSLYKVAPESKIKRALHALSLSNNLSNIYIRTYSVFKEQEIKTMLNNQNFDLTYPLRNINLSNFKNTLNKILYMDQKILVGEYFNMVADKMTMANSLEERVPYLDKLVVDLAFRIPPNFKINGKTEKFILKKLGKNILPKITTERKKQGYGAPYFEWIKEEIGDIIISKMENPTISKDKLIDKEFIKKQMDKTKNSQAESLRSWMLYSLEKWYEENITKS